MSRGGGGNVGGRWDFDPSPWGGGPALSLLRSPLPRFAPFPFPPPSLPSLLAPDVRGTWGGGIKFSGLPHGEGPPCLSACRILPGRRTPSPLFPRSPSFGARNGRRGGLSHRKVREACATFRPSTRRSSSPIISAFSSSSSPSFSRSASNTLPSLGRFTSSLAPPCPSSSFRGKVASDMDSTPKSTPNFSFIALSHRSFNF